MELLLSEAAYERIKHHIEAIAPALDVVTLGTDGKLERNGAAIEPAAADPDIAYMSFDLLAGGMLPAFLASVDAATRVQWMQLLFAGLTHPACRPAMQRGVRLTKSSAQAISVAEYVLAHALSLLHPIGLQRELQTQREFRRTPFREIGQTRWLVIGAGEIGTAIAQRIKPFGAHLTIARRSLAHHQLADQTIGLSGLPGALAAADVVVLACALNGETVNMADDGFFGALKEGAILINAARGALIDDDALLRGLEDGKPAYAVLDVFRTEPLPASSWMWMHPHIRITGHTSNDGAGRTERGDVQFLANLERFISGLPLLNEAHQNEFT